MYPTQNSFAITERVTTSLEATSEERQARNLHSLAIYIPRCLFQFAFFNRRIYLQNFKMKHLKLRNNAEEAK